jgi:hypothetical protein
MYRFRLRWIIWRLRYQEQKVLDWLPGHMPKRWINHLTMGNLGRLTVTDERLHAREVPTITVEEIGNAMKYDEALA